MEKPIRELTITRTFDTPRERVWKAWTDQNLVKTWWGPRGVSNPTCIWEAKPDGKIHIVMLAERELGLLAGQKWPMNGMFREVLPQSRLVFTSNALGDHEEHLLENVVTVDLYDIGRKTKMVLHVKVTKAMQGKTEVMLQGMDLGWNQSIDKLGEMLRKKR